MAAIRGKAQYSTLSHVFHVLGPELGLAAEDVLGLWGAAKSFRDGVEAVDGLDRAEAADAFVCWPFAHFDSGCVLIVVKIGVGAWRHHDIVPFFNRGDSVLPAAPEHHGGIGRETAFADFVPADDFSPFLYEHFVEAPDEVGLKLVLVFEPFTLDHGLGEFGLFPLFFRSFVSADMDVGGREEGADFREDVVSKLEGFFFWSEGVFVDAPHGLHFRRVAFDVVIA